MQATLIRWAAIAILSAAFAGCSYIGLGPDAQPETEQTAPQTAADEPSTPVAVEELEKPATRRASDIEVLWEIPGQPVDGFVVRYGFAPNEMIETVKLPADRFDKYEDPKHGFVYRYTVRNIPAEKRVYLTVSAYQGEQESAPSAVFEVAP